MPMAAIGAGLGALIGGSSTAALIGGGLGLAAGMLGGESSSSAAQDPYEMQQPEMPYVDMSPIYAAMGGMMEMMAASQVQNQKNQLGMMLAQAPQPTATPTYDWKSRAAALKEKISGQVSEEAAARRGRASTILTSPLTDEDVTLTTSVLTGK